ncbi:hypothetical protein F4821DRAFT_275751 [Hypoxylon rubiginosum]|uniref:Uncharacterized protein n=1 Tax=Hypoxylon rubiginosum TaxID=110542 RepID=A0ACC0DAY3_9PEZI|nr:hypothetical protein F4821DRAFT_275751 [Hypoxylon rubiginosum]
MNSPAEAVGPADDGDALRRACDQCRLRKVRCDRRSPCANCTTAKYQCSFTSNGPRPRESRQRVLISSQYERKIDYIESRLDKITNLVEKIAENQSLTGTPNSRGASDTAVGPSPIAASPALLESGVSQRPEKPTASIPHPDRNHGGSAFQGNSSVTAHAAFAGQFIEDAVTRHTSLESVHPNMRVAMSSLQQLLRMQSQHNTASETHLAHAQPLGPSGLSRLPMAPLPAVVDVLRELKERKPVTFTLICAFDSVDYFTEQCKKIYFPTENFSQAAFISVNAGLYYIFQEKTALAVQAGDTAAASTYREHTRVCRDNLETALANLSLLMPSRKETVEALIMAASYATEISKPSLAWQLNAAACQVCLALGYHRKDFLPGENEHTRNRRVARFWLVYILDKALALRFGRSSNLQDYDITVPRLLGPLGEFEEHRETIHGWLRHAEAQAETYEKLYSPIALLRPVEQRVQSARACAEMLLREVHKLTETRKRLESEGSVGTDGSDAISAMLLKSDEVSILSTLTLVYRAVPPGAMAAPPGPSSMFCVECIDCARDVVQLHLECTELFRDKPELATAAILFSPFIPFIVLFCHAIENCHSGDLQRVEKFKTSLEPFRSVSEPVDRLYRLCEVLYNVAVLYFEAKQNQQDAASGELQQHHHGHGHGTVGNELEMYLNQAGLLPMDDAALRAMGLGFQSAAYEPGSPGVDAQASQAANWYFGYMNMVGWSESSPSSWPQ